MPDAAGIGNPPYRPCSAHVPEKGSPPDAARYPATQEDSASRRTTCAGDVSQGSVEAMSQHPFLMDIHASHKRNDVERSLAQTE